VLLHEQSGGLPVQDPQRVSGDHQFLVGGNDVASEPRSFARNPPGALGVRLRIKIEVEPGQRRATTSRMAGAFSPIPAVNTKPSMPFMAAATIPVNSGDAVDEIVRSGSAS
jgi:hypothetical protein